MDNPIESAPQDTGMDLSAFDAAIDAYNAPADQQHAPAPKPAPEPAPAKEKPAATPDKPEAPKKPWETKAEEMPKEEADEPKPAEPAVEEQFPKGLKETERPRWGELRKTETLYKQIAPEYEKLKAEVEQLRTASATPKVPEEVEKELNDLRQFQAAYDVENTPDFVEAVSKPITAQLTRLQEVADYAKVNLDALMKATDEPNSLRRKQAIKQVLSESTEEVDDAAVAEAVEAANALHPLYAKGNELREKALEIQSALKGKQKVQTEQQKQAQQQQFQRAQQEMGEKLEANFKPLGFFEDAAFKKEVFAEQPADPAADPMMAAYQAQAGKILPTLMNKYNEVIKELHEQKRINAARGKAKAPLGDRTQAPTPEQPPEFEDALDMAIGQYNGQRR